METIKNYLEAMFASMPNTEAVRKAKDELFSMMEDKYNELKEEGVSENEAVGTVISEFGNLEELAESLGVKEELQTERAKGPRRYVSSEEVKKYLNFKNLQALRTALGTFLCIISISVFMFFEMLGMSSQGVGMFFLPIAIAIGLFIYNGCKSSSYKYMESQACQINLESVSYAEDARNKFQGIYGICMAIGVICCAFSWIPFLLIEGIKNGELSTVIMFFLIAFGTFLIVYVESIEAGYKRVLSMNEAGTISGNYGKKEVSYDNNILATFMSVYSPTIVCAYLLWSFLSFRWEITWILFPIAFLVKMIIEKAFGKEN